MLGYGFSIPANPFDHYSVGFKVPSDSPLAEARAWRAAESAKVNKKSKANDEYRYYIFNVEHPRAKSADFLETSLFSQDLFDSISVLSANYRELQSHTFRSTGFVFHRDPKRLSDRRRYRNLLHTLSQLRLECFSRMAIIRANRPQLKESDAQALSQKEQYAKFYRDSQVAILETAALLCRYCVLRAQTPHEKPDLIIAAAATKNVSETPGVTDYVQKLIHRALPAIKIRTLFNFSDAVQLLPETLAMKIRQAVKVCGAGMREKSQSSSVQPLASSNDLQEKIGFTFFLAGLRRVYSERSVVLPSHLKSWMRDLQTWYPFDDQFWNGPTEEFLPTLEALVEATDQIVSNGNGPIIEEVWSDPQMLCWGWNVQEEEGLFCDTEEISQSNVGVTACRPSNYQLCIPGVPVSNGLPK
jgi:hypothetical protein